MSAETRRPTSRWLSFALGPVVLLAVVGLQAAVFSRLVGAYHTKFAERVSPGHSQAEDRLKRALAADPSNGWTWWLFSRVYLHKALLAKDRADQLQAAAEQAGNSNDRRRAAAFQLASEKEKRERDNLLDVAKEHALRGARSFNSIGCYKQLASIYMRREIPSEAERYLQLVVRVKPDDIEAIERLGLLKLDLKKWDELEQVCQKIFQKHPYSANAYFYMAFVARERNDAGAFKLNLRQAYVMMQQNTGTIFFDRAKLEQIVEAMGLAESYAPPAKPSAKDAPR